MQELPHGYPILVLSLAVAAAASIMLSISAARRRSAPLAVEFMLLMAAVGEWCIGYFFELVSADPSRKILWARIQYLGIEALPVLWILLSAGYSGRIDLSRPRWILPLSLIPLVSLALVFTNDSHGLIWAQIIPDSVAGLSILRYVHGPWFWVSMVYAYLLLSIGTVLFLSSLITSPSGFRRQALAVILGVAVPWVGNTVYLLGNPFGVDITPFCFVASGAFFSWALFYRHFLDIVPFARDSVIESMQDPFIVVERDERIADLNPAARTLIGAGTRDVLGMHASRIFPGWKALIGSVRAERAIVDGFSMPAGSGTRFFDADVSVLRDRRGRPAGKSLVLHDTTGRRIMEEALRKSEEKYRGLVESMGDVIFSLDVHGSITYISPMVMRMSGYKPGEVVGSHYSRFVHPDDLDFVTRGITMSYRGVVGPVEFKLRDSGGSPKIIRADAFPLKEKGKVTGLTGIITDITMEKQLMEQLHQARKMEAVGRLAGGIAHDFNNLLTAITGFAEMIRSSETGGDAQEWVSEIKKAVSRGAGLVRQLLTFSRKQNMQPQPLDLNALILDMEKILERLLGKEVGVVTHLAEDLELIYADLSQIELVLINLAVNSRDAMPGGGVLTMETANADSIIRKGRRDVILRISDTGCGMDENVKTHLFEPFFTTKELGKGTGLGLSTVYGIVKQSGGRIKITSVQGIGTSVEIRFPRHNHSSAFVNPSRRASSDNRPND